MKTFLSRHVARILLAIIAVASPVVARAALVTYTVTITNTPLPGAGTNLTVNGVTRNWTNAASLSGIQTNSAGVSASATNLFRSWASFPQVGVTVYQTATNVVTFRGLDITVTQGGTWASVTSSSSSTTTSSGFQLPASASFVSQLWTNIDELSTNRNFGRLNLTAGLGLHGRYLVATNYTLTTNDLYIGADTRSNTNLILTLPSASSASNLLFLIKDEGGAGATNTIKIYPASGERIDTLLTNLVISNNYGGVQLRSRGTTNWAILASGGGVTGGIAGSGSGVPLTNSVWVSKNGSDSTGARGDPSKAFLTLGAAKTNAVSKDTIFVMPGVFEEFDLNKDGVNWHFFNGSVVSNTSSSVAIFDWSVTSGSFNVSGNGEFIDTAYGSGGVIYCSDSSAITRFQFKRMWSDGCPVLCLDGQVFLSGEIIESDGNIGSQGVVRLGNAPAKVTVYNTRIRANGSGFTAIPVKYNFAANTNLLLKDCSLIAGSGAYAIDGVGATKVSIEGTLTANAGFNNVTLLNAENTTTIPGTLSLPGTNQVSVLQAGILTVTDSASIHTNTAPFTIDTTDFALDTNYTNGPQRAWISASIVLGATPATYAQVILYLDQDADSSFEQTGMQAYANGAITNAVQLGAYIQPGGIFTFTNLSSGGTASVGTGSSQWVKQ